MKHAQGYLPMSFTNRNEHKHTITISLGKSDKIQINIKFSKHFINLAPASAQHLQGKIKIFKNIYFGKKPDMQNLKSLNSISYSSSSFQCAFIQPLHLRLNLLL